MRDENVMALLSKTELGPNIEDKTARVTSFWTRAILKRIKALILKQYSNSTATTFYSSNKQHLRYWCKINPSGGNKARFLQDLSDSRSRREREQLLYLIRQQTHTAILYAWELKLLQMKYLKYYWNASISLKQHCYNVHSGKC